MALEDQVESFKDSSILVRDLIPLKGWLNYQRRNPIYWQNSLAYACKVIGSELFLLYYNSTLVIGGLAATSKLSECLW